MISVYDTEEDAVKFEKMCSEVGLKPDQYIIRRRYLPESSDFGITLSDGRTLPSAFWDNPTGLNFNGKGVLSVPIFQAKGHTEASKTEVETKEGMIIFNTTLKKFQGYDGSAWVNLH